MPARRLTRWYAQNRRAMPWRANPEPYFCWLSEIMLQQTTYEQALPYYERFLARFPTVESLAAADEQDVLKASAGLGYYARARNLHRAAQHAGFRIKTFKLLIKNPFYISLRNSSFRSSTQVSLGLPGRQASA